ncbi:hypothetical protein [Micromonospora cathayae]|uniref:Secreted protein n=1 Tax=Micromonospora cathayae TaxID=3028804 RepID=A0ABY7ZVL5_9ACTN|nr:hypothetical protein [Micromonospora sp. HUAS 3]WDZ87062.1 hypothetical protein PVK37_11980 [Micromonospora sp. HUAS 3]
MTSTEQRLAAIRGDVPARRHNARTIAALTGNPGCTRRAVLDSAGVDKPKLAERIGFPARFGQSRFAISRGNAFEAQVKSDGGTELLRLVAERVGADPEEPATWTDLNAADPTDRYDRSRDLLTTAGDAPALFDHPLLSLEVAGQRVYLEPDLVAARLAGRWHVVEIKSFPVVDGQADPAKVAAAAIQSAVYVLALRELLAAAGHDPELVSPDVVLVCPRDFANQPVASLVDVRRQLLVLRRQLDRMARIDALLAGVPEDFTADPTAEPAALVAALRTVEARYAPDCLAACELAFFCRDEARGQTGALGRPVREALGGVATVADVLALADGVRPAEPGQAEAAALLRAAARLRAEALAQSSSGPGAFAQQPAGAGALAQQPAGAGAFAQPSAGAGALAGRSA